MNKDEMRILIAEACGWKYTSHPIAKKIGFGNSLFWCKENDFVEEEELPDFLYDLNAMYQAENIFTQKQWNQYPIWLAKVIAGTQNQSRASGTRIYVPQHCLLHATAAQRAEAFCRVVYPEKFKK